MTRALRGRGSILLAGLLLPLVLGNAAADEPPFGDCREQVGAEIERLGVAAYVRDVSYYTKWVGHDRATGVNAWVTLDNCRGDLVIEMNRACELVEAYGHGDCGRSIPTTYSE